MRLIDADELRKAFKKSPLIFDSSLSFARKLIDLAPTIKFTEEDAIDKLHETGWLPRHDKAMTNRPKGKWLKSSNMSKRSYQRLCSNCKHIVYFCGDGNYPNCPYCLADMRGEENG